MNLDYWHFCLVFPCISILFLAVALCMRLARVLRGPIATPRIPPEPPTSYDEPEAALETPPRKKRDF